MSVRTHSELKARLRIVRDAFLDASDRYRNTPRDREHHAEAVEWGILRDKLRHEITITKRQVTAAARREGEPQ